MRGATSEAPVTLRYVVRAMRLRFVLVGVALGGWGRPSIVGAAAVVGPMLADGLSLLPVDEVLLTTGAIRSGTRCADGAPSDG